MASPRTPEPDPAGETPLPHFAARLEDSFHEFREKRALRRGQIPIVIPFAGYGSTTWLRVFARIVLGKTGARNHGRKIRGWRSFISVPLNDVDVVVTVAGVDHHVTADRGGVVDARIEAELRPGWNTITIHTEGSEPTEAPIFVVDPATRFGMISDVDDTVMVTALPRPFLAAWNTFVLDEHARRPVAGMAVMYERILQEHRGAPCFYLSTGAWNVAPTLSRFLKRNLYPRGPLLLTDWGPTHDRWFRSGRQHKEKNLRRLAREFPDIKWLLIGDDGQHDEEIYGDFLSDHPDQVAAVAIRQLSPGQAVLAGGRSRDDARSSAPGASVPWYFAPDGAGLVRQVLETDTPD